EEKMKIFKKLAALSVTLLLVSGCTKVDPATSESTSLETSDSVNEETSSEEIEESSSEETSVEPKTVQEQIEDLIANAEKSEAVVVSSTVTTSSVYSWGGGETSNLSIEYGKNENGKLLKKTTVSTYDDYVEYFYHTADETTECYKYDNSTEKYTSTSVNEEDFDGYSFVSGILNPEYNTIRGALAATKQIVSFGLVDSNHDLVLEMVDDYSFTIKFGYSSGNEFYMSYFYTDATISFDSTTGAVKSVVSTLYRPDSSAVVIDDENNTFSIPDLASCTNSSVNYSQAFGVLADLNFPYYSLTQWQLVSFDVALDDHVISQGETVTIELGSFGLSKSLTLVNPNPSTFVADFEKFTIEGANGYFNSYSNSFSFFISSAGLYEVSIACACGYTISLSINATAPNPQTISFSTVTNEGTAENPSWSIGTVPSTLYLGKSINIYATVSPSTADQSTTITCSSGETLPTGKFTNWSGNEYTYYTFTPTEKGTYTFTATSTVLSTVTQSVTIEVVDAPDYSTLFAGTFYNINFKGEYLQHSVNFVTEATESTPGSAVFTLYERTVVDGSLQTVVSKTVNYTYTVDKDSGVCTFTLEDGAEPYYLHQLVSATITEEGDIYMTVREGSESDPDGYISYYNYYNQEHYDMYGIY
ncbi:MAG: hypothetical protein ACI31G_02540, partial [Bacilli bacterium]